MEKASALLRTVYARREELHERQNRAEELVSQVKAEPGGPYAQKLLDQANEELAFCKSINTQMNRELEKAGSLAAHSENNRRKRFSQKKHFARVMKRRLELLEDYPDFCRRYLNLLETADSDLEADEISDPDKPTDPVSNAEACDRLCPDSFCNAKNERQKKTCFQNQMRGVGCIFFGCRLLRRLFTVCRQALRKRIRLCERVREL